MRTLWRVALIASVWTSTFSVSVDASGTLRSRDGLPIPVQSHRITTTLLDGLARSTTRQTFVSPHSRPLEAIYEFPIPETAAIVGIALEAGGQRMEGLLAERRTARKVYDDIVRRRRDPALVEQVGRSTFRLSVFPVLPKQPTVVEITWIETLRLTGDEYRYVYPLAMGGAAAETAQDLTFSMQVRTSTPITAISSPNQGMLCTHPEPWQARASLERVRTRLDEDLVVVTRVETPDPTLAVHAFRAPGGDAYFAAVVTPPPLTDDALLRRDITLLIDVSGSMDGTKLAQAKSAARRLLDGLRAGDRIEIVLFSDVLRRFADAPVEATEATLAKLRAYVDGATARGGTALGDAIADVAARTPQPDRVTSVVVLTDGLPTIGITDRQQIIELAKHGGDRGIRLYLFGVGRDVDAALLDGVAAASGGDAQVFRPDGEIGGRLRTFFQRTASPAIADLSITVDGHKVDDLLPRQAPPVYLGEQAVLVGRAPGDGWKRCEVRGRLGKRRIHLQATVDLGQATSPVASGEPAARDLYARARLADYQRALRLRSQLNDAEYFAALDRGAYSTNDELIAAQIELSLATGVQCPYTSFLALLPEDAAGLNPRDAAAIQEAMDRAAQRRRDLLEAATKTPGSTQEVATAMPSVAERLESNPFGGEVEIAFDEPDMAVDEVDEDTPGLGGRARPPSTDASPHDVMGVGGGSGGKRYGGNYGGRGVDRGAGRASQVAVEWGLEWLKRHQDPQGYWSDESFNEMCQSTQRGTSSSRHAKNIEPGTQCDGKGVAGREVGVTGLATLAFLGSGHTVSTGKFHHTVRKATRYLVNVQNAANGSFVRPDAYPDAALDNAFATLAMVEVYGLSQWPMLRDPAQRAIDFLLSTHDDDAWDADTSEPEDGILAEVITCGALVSAKHFGLHIDHPPAQRTEPEPRATLDSLLHRYRSLPDVTSSALSEHDYRQIAAALLSRILLGDDPVGMTELTRFADLLRSRSARDNATVYNDLHYAYIASHALHQFGGAHWHDYQRHAFVRVLDTQRRDDDTKGSWDPPAAGRFRAVGRVYATAMRTLCLEVYYRYENAVRRR